MQPPAPAKMTSHPGAFLKQKLFSISLTHIKPCWQSTYDWTRLLDFVHAGSWALTRLWHEQNHKRTLFYLKARLVAMGTDQKTFRTIDLSGVYIVLVPI